MRSSNFCLVLAGLSGIAHATAAASPPAQDEVQAEPRGLIARGLSHAFFPRQATTPTEQQPPTKRQAAPLPPDALPSTQCQLVNDANRTAALTVQSGDTLEQIAFLMNSGICNIANLNNITNIDFIRVGQVLQVPFNLASPDSDSCRKRRGPVPSSGSTNGTAKPPPPSRVGKETRRRRRSGTVFWRNGDQSH